MDKVTHFEIPADDLGRAKMFYQDIFGWQIQEIPGVQEFAMVYTVPVDEKHMPKEVGAINGDIMKRSETGKYPIIVINVSSIDEYVKKVESAGGKLVQPKQQIMDIGFYARISDTEGNVVGLWEDLKKG